MNLQPPPMKKVRFAVAFTSRYDQPLPQGSHSTSFASPNSATNYHKQNKKRSQISIPRRPPSISYEYRPQPTCCCDCCPLRFGTCLLGLFELAFSILLLTVTAFAIHYQYGLEETKRIACDLIAPQTGNVCPLIEHDRIIEYGYYISAAILGLWVFSSVTMIYAVIHEQSIAMIPHILVQFVILLFAITYIALYLYVYIDGQRRGM